MESRAEKYLNFFKAVIQLQAFPVVVVYMILIPASLLWKNLTSPLGLHKVIALVDSTWVFLLLSFYIVISWNMPLFKVWSKDKLNKKFIVAENFAELVKVLVVYNFLCSALSLYSFAVVVKSFYTGGWLYTFAMVPDADVTHAFFIYWITKHLELLDTVFMIVRHRQRQITFLHVYHHASILLLSDYAYHVCPWPAIGVMLGMNSFVHVFLYLYYGQAALYPSQRPQWKQRMTQLQMIQFVVGIFHSSVGYLHHGFCVYSIFYGISMLGLFGNFYYQAFLKVRRDKKTE